MDRYLLGKEIKRRRVELKLTQKQLSLGICKQSIISKIENGEFFPSFELIVSLSNRLKLTISYLIESAICEEFHFIDKHKKEVYTLITNRKFEEAFIIADNILKTKEFLIGEHKNTFTSYRAISAYKINLITPEDCICILEKCISESKYYMNYNQKLINHNAQANIYVDIRNFDKALEKYEEILVEIDKEVHDILYLFVLFNYANTLHTLGHYEKALLIIIEGITSCKMFESIKMLGSFYYLKGECLIDLGYTKEEISLCFKKALFYFDMLHNDEYIKILWDNFYEYI